MKRRVLLKALIAVTMSASSPALAGGGKPLRNVDDLQRRASAGAGGNPIHLEGSRYKLLVQTVTRLRKLENLVGYGNFNILGFDDALNYARDDSAVGAFPPIELDFLEEIFFADAARYGFFGSKVMTEITATIPKPETTKIPGSGHHLFKGRSLELYHKAKKDVGDNLVLTSGIRGIVKQMCLFLGKAVETGGNLSLASHSLAPPGHSYHGIGDFDVGKRGLGHRNFMAEFATTDEFKRLMDLDFVEIRYPAGNPYGVRFEPWHISVV
jgi:hypothetical protein